MLNDNKFTNITEAIKTIIANVADNAETNPSISCYHTKVISDLKLAIIYSKIDIFLDVAKTFTGIPSGK